MADVVAQLVWGIGGWEIGRRVTPGASLDCHDVQPVRRPVRAPGSHRSSPVPTITTSVAGSLLPSLAPGGSTFYLLTESHSGRPPMLSGGNG